MDKEEIEAVIEEIREGASEPAFDFEKGPIRVINNKRYADLLEHFIRTQLSKKNE